MLSRQKVMPNCALKKNKPAGRWLVVLQEIVQYCEDPAVLVKYYASLCQS